MPIFKRFNQEDIVRANPTEVTTGLWPDGSGQVQTFTIDTGQRDSRTGEFYLDVMDANGNDLFSLAYGHVDGLGHPTLVQDANSTLATKATYAQYRNLLLDPSDERFTFAGGYSSDHIYVINLQRSLIKERLDPGNWKIRLGNGVDTFTFVDDSGQAFGTAYGRSGKVFNIIAGDIGGPSGPTVVAEQSANFGGFGLVYPSLGIIVLNPDALTEYAGLDAPDTTASATPTRNYNILYDAIVAGGNFVARSSENISSTHYFVRLRASEFNYTNNNTFFDDSNGDIIFSAFTQDPRVYVTTVGLYNDNNELLAVAKMSQPIQKGFDRELNLKVRLDF